MYYIVLHVLFRTIWQIRKARKKFRSKYILLDTIVLLEGSKRCKTSMDDERWRLLSLREWSTLILDRLLLLQTNDQILRKNGKQSFASKILFSKLFNWRTWIILDRNLNWKLTKVQSTHWYKIRRKILNTACVEITSKYHWQTRISFYLRYPNN